MDDVHLLTARHFRGGKIFSSRFGAREVCIAPQKPSWWYFINTRSTGSRLHRIPLNSQAKPLEVELRPNTDSILFITNASRFSLMDQSSQLNHWPTFQTHFQNLIVLGPSDWTRSSRDIYPHDTLSLHSNSNHIPTLTITLPLNLSGQRSWSQWRSCSTQVELFWSCGGTVPPIWKYFVKFLYHRFLAFPSPLQ